MKPFGEFYMRLKRHEVYTPTPEQLDELRALCEQDYGIDHDAPYAEELFGMACDGLRTDGVGWVYRAYEDLVRFVRLVQEAQG